MAENRFVPFSSHHLSWRPAFGLSISAGCQVEGFRQPPAVFPTRGIAALKALAGAAFVAPLDPKGRPLICLAWNYALRVCLKIQE